MDKSFSQRALMALLSCITFLLVIYYLVSVWTHSSTVVRPHVIRPTKQENVHDVSGPYKVYIYDVTELSLICREIQHGFSQSLDNLHDIDYITDNPLEATMFVVVLDENMRECGDLSKLPNWRGGRNHLVFLLSTGTAMLKGNWQNTLQKSFIARSKFKKPLDDRVSIIIPTVTDYKDKSEHNLPMMIPIKRHYTLGFRSAMPLGTSQVKNLIQALSDYAENSIITNCKSNQLRDTDLIDWQWCEDSQYQKHSLLNSTFTIVPGPYDSQYITTPLFQARFMEALQYGSIPVLIGVKHIHLPYSKLLDWNKAAIFAPPDIKPTRLMEYLQSLSSPDIFEMRRQGRILWFNYFKNERAILETTLLILRRTSFQRGPVAPTVNAVIIKLNQTSIRPDQHQDKIPSGQSNTLPVDTFHRFGDPFHEYSSLPFAQPYPLGIHPDGMQQKDKSKFTTFQGPLLGHFPSENLTVVILSYKRNQCLPMLIGELDKVSIVERIVIIWNDIHSSIQKTWKSEKTVVVQAKQNSLNNRFIPYDIIRTDCVLIVDDDMQPNAEQIMFGFRVWRESRDRIVGFIERTIVWKNDKLVYEHINDKEYTLILPKPLFIHVHYFHMYTNIMPAVIRDMVRINMNCEDIAINFLVSHITKKPPLQVQKGAIKTCDKSDKGLSDRKSHYEFRSKCLNFFTKVYGYVPLLFTGYKAS